MVFCFKGNLFFLSCNKDGYFDSLNGADIDMPEWMFSKIMRSAKIRFADHSMLRVIQILGKFGNWRRVLQVIEWIQARERFKSHKLRYILHTFLLFLFCSLKDKNMTRGAGYRRTRSAPKPALHMT